MNFQMLCPNFRCNFRLESVVSNLPGLVRVPLQCKRRKPLGLQYMKIVSTIFVCAHALLCKVSALHKIICSIVSFSTALSRSRTLTLSSFSSRRRLVIDPCTRIKVLVFGYNRPLFFILNNFIFSSAVSRIFVKTNGYSKQHCASLHSLHQT